MLECLCPHSTHAHPTCSVLSPQGQLGASALPLGRRKGPGRGPVPLRGQPLSPRPGSPGLAKIPEAQDLDTEDPVLQVTPWAPRPLELSGALQAQRWARARPTSPCPLLSPLLQGHSWGQGDRSSHLPACLAHK